MVICPRCAAEVGRQHDGYRCAACAVTYPVDDGVATFIPPSRDIDGFEERFVELLDGGIDRQHFWFRARNEIIFALYRRFAHPGGRFLEIGCGTGVVLDHLVARGVAAEGLDALPAAATACRARNRAPIWIADARRLPFSAEFDAVGMFDCLEHVSEHDVVLHEIRQALRPGGGLIVTVPAGPRLWSRVDDAMGHVRRYTRDDLRAVLERAGFQVVRLTHYNTVLMPLYWLHRALLGRRRTDADLVERAVRLPPRPVNEILYWIMRSESWLLARRDLPRGVSLAAVAVRG